MLINVNPLIPSTCEADLRADGFEPGAPSTLKVLERCIDWETAKETTCDLCGHAGMEYRPWHRQTAYRFLMCCPQCGYSVEG